MLMDKENAGWLAPSAIPKLCRDEIHIWRARLDLSLPRIQELKQILSVDEQARANQYRFPIGRTRFIAARGILRTLLGSYLGREPRTLQFTYNEYGKPALLGESESDPILFNLTHSQSMAIYAFTYLGDIGVDLELMAADVKNYDAIANRYFSPAEMEELQSVPAERRQKAFLNCWTRKEAYIKARGLGLSLSLNQFDVSLAPGTPGALLATREPGQDHSQWSIHALAPGLHAIAAIAVKGHPSTITCWQWPE
jgi:4'-phosphopantetheinyl transferase